MEERIKELEERVELLEQLYLEQYRIFKTLNELVGIHDKVLDILTDSNRTLRSYCNLNGEAIKKLAKEEPID